MRNAKWFVAFGVLSSWLTACEVGDGDFDGSIFDDAGQEQRDASIGDAGADEDGGEADAATTPDAGDPVMLVPDDSSLLFAMGVCAGFEACLGQDRMTTFFRNSECEDLIAAQQADRDLYWITDAVLAGTVNFHPEALGECRDDLAQLGCDVQRMRLPASCKRALEGTVDAGGDCTIDHECAGDAFCDKGTPEACPGACKALLPLSSSCTGSSECQDGLICSTRTRTCVEPLGIGDDCSDDPCGLGLECIDGECVDLYRGQAGDACDAAALAGPLCRPGLVCASQSSGSTAGTCIPKSERNGPCKRSRPNACPDDQYCDATPGESSTCIDIPAGSCVNGTLCARGFVCASGTCEPLPTDGEACIGGQCAADHVCVGGICHELTPAGGTCEGSSDCYSGACESDLCVTPLNCGL